MEVSIHVERENLREQSTHDKSRFDPERSRSRSTTPFADHLGVKDIHFREVQNQ